ncbi:ATP-binding protein [Paraburkholderia megapolitana]|uniref:Virulence sensor protein BvgS n=1 Tax=Paraburkholderia megapolitana TaxID=420953 RepID=A0A1I3G494_9BURK|nr:ATP-binding protein [Paraburkholderia megapolitana]QDQ82705.1 response regulator [Paraburkholderia megapolitana]SFI18284.1 Signal transduction histidine kinase [Paraburkholderia megapolitana]
MAGVEKGVLIEGAGSMRVAWAGDLGLGASGVIRARVAGVSLLSGMSQSLLRILTMAFVFLTGDIAEATGDPRRSVERTTGAFPSIHTATTVDDAGTRNTDRPTINRRCDDCHLPVFAVSAQRVVADGTLRMYKRDARASMVTTVRAGDDGRWRIYTLCLLPLLLALSTALPIALRKLHLLRREITERKQHERQLTSQLDLVQTTSQTKDDFLATMSHELRTPMNGVLGLVDMLERMPLTAEQREMLGTINVSAITLLQILDDLLDYSRIEAGHLTVESEPLDLRQLIDSTVTMMVTRAHEKGLSVRMNIASDLAATLRGDRARLRQVLLNLLGNAIKFTSSGRIEVDVSATYADAQHQIVEIAVTDSGIGIAPDVQMQIFEPFVQAEPSTSRRFGGVGLGLAICRRLVHLMGGTLELRSAPGVGTCVTLRVVLPVEGQCYLPDVLGDDRLASPSSTLAGLSVDDIPALPDRELAIARGTLVLVAEDDPVHQALIRHQLASLGFACDVVDDGTQALAALKQTHYGCLISDCHMPGLSGYGLARWVRENEWNACGVTGRTKILGITANTGPDDPRLCREAGMDDCIVKPVRLAALREHLGKWFGEPGAYASSAPPAQEAPRPSAPIDLTYMTELWGSETTVKTLLEAFVSAVRDDMRALHPLLDDPDVERLLAWHHRVAGAASVLQYPPLLDVLEAYRRDIVTKPIESLRADGLALLDTCNALLDDIEAQATSLA